MLAAGTELRHYDQRRPAELERVSPGWDGEHRSTFNTFVISLPPDSIREFQIQTGTYTAELGGAGTGQINVVTKAGRPG